MDPSPSPVPNKIENRYVSGGGGKKTTQKQPKSFYALASTSDFLLASPSMFYLFCELSL
jgi:hypothetical protein